MGIVFEGLNHFARTVGVIEQGIQEGAHSSCQLSIIYQGERSAHLALGSLLSPGEKPTAEHSYLWMSSGKPMTAMGVALLVEAGRLDWDTRVAEVIPEFGNRGKEVITLRHILSHSAALRQADRVEAPSREAILEMIYDLSLDEGQTPGLHAGYHAGGTWFVLGEVIKRVSGDPVEVFLASNVFEPLGMKGATLGLSAGGLPESFVPMWDTFKRDADQKRIHPIFGTEAGLRMPRPGRSMIGPIRDLARFYEEMRRILLEQSDFISKKTLDEMMVPQRVKGKVDLTFGHPADFGLGFYLHPEKYKVGKVSYGYGRLASEMSFGHSGAQSSCAFFDPPNDLVVAWVCDGMPGELRHQRRARAINEAIYTDLGLDE